MGIPSIFSTHLVLLLQCIALYNVYAAPSPIIRFPGDDSTPVTDKEVALVSRLILFFYILKYVEATHAQPNAKELHLVGISIKFFLLCK